MERRTDIAHGDSERLRPLVEVQGNPAKPCRATLRSCSDFHSPRSSLSRIDHTWSLDRLVVRLSFSHEAGCSLPLINLPHWPALSLYRLRRRALGLSRSLTIKAYRKQTRGHSAGSEEKKRVEDGAKRAPINFVVENDDEAPTAADPVETYTSRQCLVGTVSDLV